ncbi:Serine/threonine-protein phosphatase rdgC [Orchesella cincta]|uniref:Serine/threonine-protein phosphatase n=1 Tax=Orchesella cincta TaxID=48709 RepID=A0A1D2MFK2_ORCCI|nr:Serine/threonine-protein phosphatase rdgC [Orchesella cincta]
MRSYEINSKILHVKYVAQILRVAAASLKALPNFHQPSTSLSKQITICGDLHGKLDDLLVIFYKNGLPSPENPYVFNGDYVDRGKRSVEILLVLLSCFLLCPDGVFLNRGNHEDHIMNMRYGFIREVRLKYKVFSGRLLTLIDQVYRSLPLGTIIDGRVLVVHGGISETTDLKLITDIDRQKYVSILRPPVLETMNSDGRVLDLLWSDPQNGTGCSPNTFRGGGSYFGSDVTEKVLKKHGLQLLIRSHECKPDGYEFMHSNKCLTVFSASNYYEEGSNKGAYVRLLGGPSEPVEPYFVQFNAATPKLRSMTIRQRVGLVEASALRELHTRIRERQEALTQAFNNYDTDSKGLISVNDWCVALEASTDLKLPWRLLRPKLAELDSATGLVKFATTFQEETQGDSEVDVTVAEVLYRNKSSLETIFRIIDKDNSGYISMEEFAEACDLLGKHLSSPIPQQQKLEMAKSMDMNKDGKIDLNEFMETFRIVSAEHEQDDSLDYEELDD